MSRGFLFFIFFLSFSKSNGQSITPFTINIAGFSAKQDGYSLTISTGEAISITNFKAPNGASLNSGFLQNNPPLVLGIEDVLSKFSANEVSITPNPTSAITNLMTNFRVIGQLQFQILDNGSKLLFRSQSHSSFSAKQIKIDMSVYVAGVYYIQVFFKSENTFTKTGIYKIIKL